eukprot:SAG11_NODE_23652_length_385_cov_0.538462_1_plen_102_part_10
MPPSLLRYLTTHLLAAVAQDSDASHGWCPPTIDGAIDGIDGIFSAFQLTVRLKRKSEYYYLNPALGDPPPHSLISGTLVEDHPTEEPIHVYVFLSVHNIVWI